MTEDEIYLKFIKQEGYDEFIDPADEDTKAQIMDTYPYKVFSLHERAKEMMNGIINDIEGSSAKLKEKSKQPWKTKRKKKPWE